MPDVEKWIKRPLLKREDGEYGGTLAEAQRRKLAIQFVCDSGIFPRVQSLVDFPV
jgi:hypothetical protein